MLSFLLQFLFTCILYNRVLMQHISAKGLRKMRSQEGPPAPLGILIPSCYSPAPTIAHQLIIHKSSR